jgi:hypothetical protein
MKSERILHVSYLYKDCCGFGCDDTSITITDDENQVVLTPELLDKIRNQLRKEKKVNTITIISWQWFDEPNNH